MDGVVTTGGSLVEDVALGAVVTSPTVTLGVVTPESDDGGIKLHEARKRVRIIPKKKIRCFLVIF